MTQTVMRHQRGEQLSSLCECGSGLRAVRCCALQLGVLPPAEATRHLVPLVERADAGAPPGRRRAPPNACAWTCWSWRRTGPARCRVLYEIRKAQGNARAAEALIRRIVALDPNNLVATNELALMLLGKGAWSRPRSTPATRCASPRRTRRRTT